MARAENGIEALARNLPPDQKALLDGAGGANALKKQFERGKLHANVVEILGARYAEDAPDSETRASRLSSSRAEADTIRAQANARGKVLRKVGFHVELANDVFSLRDVVEKWAPTVDPQTAEAAAYYVRRFTEYHGEIDIGDLTKAQLRDFVEAIQSLPAVTSGKNNAGVFVRDLPFIEAVTYAEKHRVDTLSDRTRSKYLSILKRLMAFAVEQDYCKKDPWSSYKIPKDKRKYSAESEDDRRSFTPHETRQILDFVSKSKLPKFGRTTIDYWAPWIAAHHGTRIQEVCQLRICDFGIEDGVWSMRITDEGTNMRAKTPATVRWVPVHPKLIEIGLRRHIESRAQIEQADALAFQQWGRYSLRLEPLTADGRGRVSSAYGKRFGRILRVQLEITDPKAVFHSFRHRLQDAADNVGIPDSHRRYLTGRANKDSVEGGYGKGAAMPYLLTSLAQIDPLQA